MQKTELEVTQKPTKKTLSGIMKSSSKKMRFSL